MKNVDFGDISEDCKIEDKPKESIYEDQFRVCIFDWNHRRKLEKIKIVRVLISELLNKKIQKKYFFFCLTLAGKVNSRTSDWFNPFCFMKRNFTFFLNFKFAPRERHRCWAAGHKSAKKVLWLLRSSGGAREGAREKITKV